jgi:ribosomal protein S18 acetylase RimI-like enzyme
LSNALTVRLATAADVDVIHELLQHLAESIGQRSKFRSRSEDFLRYGFSGDAHFHVLLAEQDGVAVGLSLFFYNYSSWLGELGVYIQDLVVTSEARAGGVGQLLVRETARYAQQRGAAHLRLSVDRDNPGARRFYEKIGLRERTDECIYAAYDSDFRNLVETQ